MEYYGKKDLRDMRALMVKCKVLVKIYVKVYRKYPVDLFLKLIYLPVQMLMYIFLWKTLLGYNREELSYMVCYYLFVILLGYAFPFVHIATDIQKDVEQGIISNWLVRPVSYIFPVISRFVAWMICYSVVFIPAVIIVGIYRGITCMNIIAFVIYLMLGIIIEFLIWYNIGLLSLEMERIRGVLTTFRAFKSLASGSIIPISMFPMLFRIITEFLPTKFYIYTPINALLNGTDMLKLISNLLLAMFWILILAGLAIMQWNRGIGKLQTNIN